MAASTYLLELQQRRHKLISDLADCIGFSLGSVEHEVAVDYAERSVTHHNRLDAQENQVGCDYGKILYNIFNRVVRSLSPGICDEVYYDIFRSVHA